MSRSTLDLRGIAHRFERRWVLRGVDLSIVPGEVVAIAGANGAGKTTLLRIAATLLTPMRGSGVVSGFDLVRDAGEVRARVGFMGHAPALYEDLAAIENLAFSVRMRGLGAERETLLAHLAEVGLGEHADVRVRRFSAGMRRRLALVRLVVALPDLLLMDEPYASLDADGVALVNRIVGRVRERGGAVLFATHDFVAGASVTDRIVTLDGGRIADGSADPDPHPDPGPGLNTPTGGGA